MEELKDRVDQVRRMLSEATQILSMEDPSSPEGIMGTAAVQALDQIQRWIISIWIFWWIEIKFSPIVDCF